MDTDYYYTIQTEGFGEFKDRGSKFLGYSFNVNSKEDINAVLESVKEKHPKARHVCYAYKLGQDGKNFRMNDDGEPSGTAGKPILGRIERLGLSDTLVAVVRYFGGVKLGTSGLIKAYRSAAQIALDNSKTEVKTIDRLIKIVFAYRDQGKILHLVNELGGKVVAKDFSDSVNLSISIRKSKAERLILNLAQFPSISITESTTGFQE